MSVVAFQHVSKKFRLKSDGPKSWRERMAALLPGRQTGERDFWALRDVSFEVAAGESFALIGHNGSGKSTSLKLITRILEPTAGSVAVQGRIAALLELGSGFHPDLSGRENVFLNGALLGFSRKDMQLKMDEIVGFAELEQFIDMPVKHYSSGMFARLGFAIATAVDPDILITDEVLAVGDESFQRKCMERIFQFRRQGKTIIFVSHALDVVRSLCQRAAWLDHGVLKDVGISGDVINSYLLQTNLREQAQLAAAEDGAGEDLALRGDTTYRWGSREAEVAGVELLDAAGQRQQIFHTGSPLTVRIHYRTRQPIAEPRIGLAFYSAGFVHVAGPNTEQSNVVIPRLAERGMIDWRVENLPLLPGSYLLSAAIYDSAGIHAYDHRHMAFSFTVRSDTIGEGYGLIALPGHWTTG